MSDYAATQIPKPKDEQAFERCCITLWRCILKDPNLKPYGRRGQRQHGVDLVGNRQADPNQVVGVQCKCKGDGKRLTEKEVREEVEKALTFTPLLSEYIVVTTAPDDATLERLARELSMSASEGRSKRLRIHIYGWSSLENEIRRYPEALDAFDPSHTPQGNQILRRLEGLSNESHQIHDLLTQIQATTKVSYDGTAGPPININSADPVLDRQIDNLVALIEVKPKSALTSFKILHDALEDDVSDRIRFRVVTNIAACHLQLGDEDTAAQGFVEAYDLDPDNPKAVANKAIGLQLQGEWSALKSFAEPRLEQFPDNANLAASYVRGSVADQSIDDPRSRLTAAVLRTREVDAAYVHWLMSRGAHGAWWEAAIEAHEAHPHDDALEEIYACALLDRVLGGQGLFGGEALDKDSQADVSTTVDVLKRRWRDILDGSTHVTPQSSSIPYNLMIAYRLQNETNMVVETGKQALDRFPEEIQIRSFTALALLEQGDFDRARSLVSALEVSPQTISILFDVAIASEEWGEVIDLVHDHLDAFQEEEHERARVAKVRAEFELAPAERRRSILEAERDRLPSDPRASIVLARGAREQGMADLADLFFAAAINALKGTSDGIAYRFIVAQEAMARQEPAVVVDLLINHVWPERDSPELRLLARALALRTPVRDSDVQFFERLAPNVRALPAMQSSEGCLHIHRGTPQEAISPLSAAFEQAPDMESLMLLIQAHLAAEKDDPVRDLLTRADIDGLDGPPIARICFAGVCLRFSRQSRALDIGYHALLDGLANEEVVTRFLALVLQASLDPADDWPSVVGSGVWVSLVEKAGASYEVLIGDETDRPWGQIADPSNAFLAKAIGLQVGDSFEHFSALGRKEIWTVSEIKPPWLCAFHYLSKTFNQRFPAAQGFAAFPVDKDDVQPVLDHVRHSSEAERELADLYLQKNAPIAIVAAHRLGGSIDYAGYLTSIGEALRTCHGTAGERDDALALIQSHRQSGAVLDALTAWWAANLDVLDVMQERLGPLTIPATEMRHFHQIMHRLDEMRGREAMSVTYQDGKYLRDDWSPELVAQQRALVRSSLDSIEKFCMAEPFDIPDRLPEAGETLIKGGGSEAFAPAILAGQCRLLLCEDLQMRQLAEEAFGTKGVWLQSVLLSALEAGTMPLERYSEALVVLAAHDHDYVTLSVEVLLSTFQNDQSPNLVRLRALSKFVGNKLAEPMSHIRLVAGFINRIWASNPSHNIKVQKATGIVLEALLLRNRGKDWAEWGAWLHLQLSRSPQRYFWNWCIGHFMPIKDVVSLLR
ncbi:MAG: hypothetical protein OXU70_11145 [Gammaproteobacteria bacterium]|nr:hypothetical protein [Gammaproteobacteria bacterium]